MTASSTPSEIWSAILSGCPSVTDSEVNRNSLSEGWLMVGAARVSASATGRAGRIVSLSRRLAAPSRRPLARAPAALDEVDDQGHPVHPVAGTQAVLQEVGVVAGHPGARVDLDHEPWRWPADLDHVDRLQTVLGVAAAAAHGWLAGLDDLREEAVELRRRDARGHLLAERERLAQQPRHTQAGSRAGGQHA